MEETLFEQATSIGKKIRALLNEITVLEEEASDIGNQILSELIEIDGWDAMIRHYRLHYYSHPEDIMRHCKVEIQPFFNSIEFVMHDSDDDDDYTLISIRLDKTLEEQVSDAVAEDNRIKEVNLKIVEARERKLLAELKEKYDNVEQPIIN